MFSYRFNAISMAWILYVAFLPRTPGVAQEPSARSSNEPYTLKVDARTVTLDVVVTDRQGNPVNNIPSTAFKVFDDGVQEHLNYFQPYAAGFHGQNAPTDMAVSDHDASRTSIMIVVLDELNTRFEDQAFVMSSLQSFLSKQGETLAQPTMLLAATFDRLKVISDTTTSKTQLLASLRSFTDDYPWPTRSNNPVADQINATLSAIVAIAESTMGHSGRKNVVWIGEGFPTITPGSLDPASAASLEAAMRACIDLMMQTRMTLYTIDPRGLSMNPPTDDNGGFSSDPLDGQIDFSFLARSTGGKPFAGRNDIDKLMETCEKESVNFYTIAYTPPSSTTSEQQRFHSIRVVMANPEWKATTRLGYYTESPFATPEGKSVSADTDRLLYILALAAHTTMAFDGVPITISRSSSDPDLFTISVPNSAIRWQDNNDGQQSADIYLLAESFDKSEKLISHTAKLVTAKLPATSTVPSVNVLVQIPTTPPAVRLRFAVVVGTTSKVGTGNFILSAPEHRQ